MNGINNIIPGHRGRHLTAARDPEFAMLGVETRAEWVLRALCRSVDPDDLFVTGAQQKKAALICRRCPVIAECAAEALENRVEFGVWGGMTERERRALLKQHPDVDSWADFFADRQNTVMPERSA